MDLELNGKVCIVTGGSRGIGKAIARQLALEGADVAIVARTQEAVEATARELRQEAQGRILAVAADTGSDASVRSMVRQVAEAFGRVDILVNCAANPGGEGPLELARVTDEAFFGDANVKPMGYLRCAREVAPHMRQQGWGRIINLGGMRARHTGATLTSMRSAAVVAMAKNLADELGPDGINVTVVHPGPTRTEAMEETIAARAGREGIARPEAERRMMGRNAIRRMVEAREVAYVVAFLASPKSVAINGDVIPAAGGPVREIFY